MTQIAKFETFRALHHRETAFLMPNAWDAGSALLLASMGFDALATTSAGYAFSVGKRDSFAGLSRDELMANAKQMVQACRLPISADLEDGFGADPATCAETIKIATSIGVVGGSIEDSTGNAAAPIYDMGLSVARIEAAADAAKDLPFLLTARAENFICGNPDLGDTIKRLQAFSEAGADVLYAPGLPDLEAIRTVCREVDKPVNILMGLQGPRYSVSQLSDAGAKRISVGGSLARAAFGAVQRAAMEMRDNGTFEYAADAMAGGDIEKLMSQDQNR